MHNYIIYIIILYKHILIILNKREKRVFWSRRTLMNFGHYVNTTIWHTVEVSLK